MRELVFVHGRSQQGHDSIALKKEWIDTLKEGLKKSNLELPIPESQIRFPYYGDTLDGLAHNKPASEIAEVVVRGSEKDQNQRQFIQSWLEEIQEKKGITDEQIDEAIAAMETIPPGVPQVTERGVLNWRWVQGFLSAFDRWVPFGSGTSIALFTQDVYLYLNKSGIRDPIEAGVLKAMTPGVESVVVSHSLGTIVAYNMLRREGQTRGWNVPLFVTVGSPLAVKKVKESLSPIGHPSCVGKWFNAMDPDDVVALYPLDKHFFRIDPEIENKTNVKNESKNQHSITGYLNDKDVAKRIHDALIAT